MHIQRGHWILVTFRFGSTVHQSDGASKHTFCRTHWKMELCNHHSGQHCGWDCFQMDCAHDPSSRAFPPIFSFYHFVWNMRLLDSLFEIHSFCKSVRIPVDGLFRLFGILAILAQDCLWSRSPLCFGFLRTCLHRNISLNREIPWIEHSWMSCRSTRM